MALTATTLSAACGAGDLTLFLTSTTGFPAVGTVGANQPLQVEDEVMFVTGVPASGIVTVRGRGSEGTTATAHAILSPAVTSSVPSDFPVVSPGQVNQIPPSNPDVQSIGADGAIAVPTRDTVLLITKATAAALTLGAPSVASDGVSLTVIAATDAAHVITATGLIADGAAGVPEDTATFAAFRGATVIFVATKGLWATASLNAVTIT